MTCAAWRNLGWLLACGDKPLHIERCDACGLFPDDATAVEYVAGMAEFAAEFMGDVEAVGIKETGRDWPDLLVTYNKMRALKRRLMRPVNRVVCAADHPAED